MQKKKIAVMAGTPIDTEMGAHLVREKGMDAISCPISNTPEEQDALQFLSPEELFCIVCQKVEQAKQEGAIALFLYCNSLSSAIDIERLKKKEGIPVITPFDSYEKIAKEHSNILLLAANSIALQKVEKALKEANPTIEILSLGYLQLVQTIEKIQEKQEIVKLTALAELFHFFHALPKKKRIVLLACTHFPHIKEEMQALSQYPVIDPAETMLDLLEGLSK